MPDIGMIELILIGLIGFLVLGPERLPEFLGQIAGIIRQGKTWMNSLKNQLEYEKHTLTQPLEDVKNEVTSSMEEVQTSVKDVTNAVDVEPKDK